MTFFVTQEARNDRKPIELLVFNDTGKSDFFSFFPPFFLFLCNWRNYSILKELKVERWGKLLLLLNLVDEERMSLLLSLIVLRRNVQSEDGKIAHALFYINFSQR